MNKDIVFNMINILNTKMINLSTISEVVPPFEKADFNETTSVYVMTLQRTFDDDNWEGFKLVTGHLQDYLVCYMKPIRRFKGQVQPNPCNDLIAQVVDYIDYMNEYLD